MFSVGGKFTIKKAYKWLTPEYQKVEWKNLVCTKGLQAKHAFTLWLVILGRQPTADRLLRWNIIIPDMCVNEKESLNHLLFMCPYSTSVWKSILNWLGIIRRPGIWVDEVEWAQKNIKGRKPMAEVLGYLLAATVYTLWIERNNRRFNACSSQVEVLIRKIVLELHTTASARPTWKELAGKLNWYPCIQ